MARHHGSVGARRVRTGAGERLCDGVGRLDRIGLLDPKPLPAPRRDAAEPPSRGQRLHSLRQRAVALVDAHGVQRIEHLRGAGI
eukprot:3546038-Prymnesium_polylepis.2